MLSTNSGRKGCCAQWTLKSVVNACNKIEKTYSAYLHSCYELGILLTTIRFYPANIYLLKVSNRSTRKRCEICSKLTIKTPEDVLDVVLVFLLLTLKIFHALSSVSFVNFGQVNVSWVLLHVFLISNTFICNASLRLVKN